MFLELLGEHVLGTASWRASSREFFLAGIFLGLLGGHFPGTAWRTCTQDYLSVGRPSGLVDCKWYPCVGRFPWQCLVVDEGHRLKNQSSLLHVTLSQVSSMAHFGVHDMLPCYLAVYCFCHGCNSSLWISLFS